MYEFDFGILNWIQENMRCEALDAFFSTITHLADYGFVLIIIAMLLAVFKKYRKCAIATAVSMGLGFLLTNAFLKNLVARPRPCWLNPGVNMLIAVPQDYSFPSGHSMVSFIAATVLWHYDRRWGAAAYVLAVLIGFSRLYLYVHFPTDVLCGAVLGIAVGAAVMYVVRRRGAAHESDGDLPPAKA